MSTAQAQVPEVSPAWLFYTAVVAIVGAVGGWLATFLKGKAESASRTPAARRKEEAEAEAAEIKATGDALELIDKLTDRVNKLSNRVSALEDSQRADRAYIGRMVSYARRLLAAIDLENGEVSTRILKSAGPMPEIDERQINGH